MLGGQTLIKKGHRQNHQMTAVRKNPLRINNPKSPSIRSPLEMGSVELGATSTLISPNNSNGITPTHKKHSLLVSGMEVSSRPSSSLSDHPISEEEIIEDNKVINLEDKSSTKQTSPTGNTSVSSPKSSSNALHNNALIRKNPLQNSSGQLPIPPTNNKNSVTSLNKFTSLTPPVNKTHSLFSESDNQSRNNSRPSSATSTKGRKVINELVGLPNLAQQVSSIVEPNIMSPTNADRGESITTTRNLRSSFGVSRPPSAKLGISNTHVASTSTISPAHHNQPTSTFQNSSTINNTSTNNHLNEEKLPHVRPTSVKKSTFTESTTNNHHPTANHASSTAALHEIPSQTTTQQTATRSASLKSDTSPVITPSTPDSSLSYFKIKKVQRGKSLNDKKPLKVPIVPKTRELKLENGGFLNDLQATPTTEKDDEDDLQIQTKNLNVYRNNNHHLIEESPVTPSPITPNSPELSFTPVIENRKKPLKFADRDITRINDLTELTPPPQSNNNNRIPTPVLKVQEDEDTLRDIPEQESPEATRETMRQLKLLEIFPNGLDSQNKKIKYQQQGDMGMSYKEVISELKVLSSRISMLRRNEQGRKNSFKNVYNFQNDSLAMDDINNVEIEKMEKRMRRLNYYRKIMTAGLAGWKEYKTERDSYVALRRSSLVEEQGFDEMTKEDEVVEIRRFDDEYRRFKQRLNPEISTKVAKAIEQVDPQSAAMSILENMVLSKSEKIKTEEDKQLQKEKLTAEIIRWKSRWSPFGTPTMSRTTSVLSSLEGQNESIDIADADEVFDVEDVSDEEKDEPQSEDDDSEDEGDFEIIILNDLQTEDDGFFLTSTMNENEETEEKMLNQVDPRKLLKAIVAASRKPVSKTQSKANLHPDTAAVTTTTPASTTTNNTANQNSSTLPPIQPSQSSQNLLNPSEDEFVVKVSLRESRAMSQRNLSRYNGKEIDDAPQSKPALELPRLDFDTPKPPASPTDLIRKSREMALKEDMDLLHHAQHNHMDDDDDMAMINSIEEQNTFMTDSIDQNGTIDWKKEAGMMKQRQRRNSVDMPVVEEEEDMVLMNEDEEKNPSEEIIAEQLTFIEEEEAPTNTDKQKFQFNQLLQHLNSEVEYSDKTKKKKKKKHKNKDHDKIQSPRARENREESDVIEEDPSMTITTDQQLSLQPNDGAKVIIELDELLGIGAHGKVYKGFIPNYVTNTKDPVAIKKLSVKAGRFSKKFIKLEVDILKQLYHPYLVQYLGCKYSSKLKEYSIVLEYVDGGTLEHFIKTAGPIDERTVSVIVSQVLMGLEYLHSKRIIHRDLKPANILISGKGVVKITDFGVSAQLLNIEAIRTSCVGTPHYSAPEVIMVKPYSFTADIWSLGCVVFELLFGKRPYDEFNQVAAMYHMVKDEKPPMPTPNNLSPICLDFIDKCWTKDWKKRPNARELQTHPFVNNNEHVIQKFVKNMRQSLIMPNLLSQQTN